MPIMSRPFPRPATRCQCFRHCASQTLSDSHNSSAVHSLLSCGGSPALLSGLYAVVLFNRHPPTSMRDSCVINRYRRLHVVRERDLSRKLNEMPVRALDWGRTLLVISSTFVYTPNYKYVKPHSTTTRLNRIPMAAPVAVYQKKAK